MKNKFNLLRNFFYSPVMRGKEHDDGDGGSNIFDQLWQCVHTLIFFSFLHTDLIRSTLQSRCRKIPPKLGGKCIAIQNELKYNFLKRILIMRMPFISEFAKAE